MSEAIKYTNSPLVDYTKISPNKSPRNHKIDTITIHCVVGQSSVEALGAWFAASSRRASSNYGVGYDGKIGLYVEEKDRSWCSNSTDNDDRAITIEVASDTKHPYAVKDKAYAALIELIADICKRNNIKELKWKADKSLIGQVDK
jgi:N-acetyl-anhydromuramyl-L-alanine amidase AmpD